MPEGALGLVGHGTPVGTLLAPRPRPGGTGGGLGTSEWKRRGCGPRALQPPAGPHVLGVPSQPQKLASHLMSK